jgi:hypothetical protein
MRYDQVKCTQKLYHPNLDYDGNVCLNILREDWNPVLSISSCIYGLQFLFMDPNADDPLNKEAAKWGPCRVSWFMVDALGSRVYRSWPSYTVQGTWFRTRSLVYVVQDTWLRSRGLGHVV